MLDDQSQHYNRLIYLSHHYHGSLSVNNAIYNLSKLLKISFS